MRLREIVAPGRDQGINEDHTLVPVTPDLVKRVRRAASAIASDIAADLPKGQALAVRITQLLRTMDVIGGIGTTMSIYRAEMRPRDQIQQMTSVGAHWCWDSNSPEVYHHDNAYDEWEREGYDRKDLVEFVIEAEAPFQTIDWPYTIATNLIHPAEHEITVKNNSRIKVVGVWIGHKERRMNMNVVATGSYP